MLTPKGLRLIGDLPFFVSPDSSDVWANPELFLLDEQHRPRFVAGVPPDYFSARGSSGAIPSMTGRHFVAPVTAGGSTAARAAGSCGRDSPRSFPWLCRCLARAGRRTDGPNRPMGAGSGRGVLHRGRERVGSVAIHRRGFGADHARRGALRDQFHCRGCACFSSRSTAARITRTCLTITRQHGGVHRYARQSHDSRLV